MEPATSTLLTNGTGITLDEHCQRAWDFWRGIKSPKMVMAPMVEQSDLPYRLLAREYGAGLCYSPMIHSRYYAEGSATARSRMFETTPEDRPLVVQFSGHEPETLLAAGRAVEHLCDAVDLNLGCPQNIAKRGRYGAFLLEEQDLVLEIVRTLSAGLRVPLTVKMRILPDQPRSATVAYAQKLVQAGASVLALHGRTRHEKAHLVGAPDWATIASVVSAVGIPVIANGGIATNSDVINCLADTGAAAVMTSEMALCNPYLFGAVTSAGETREVAEFGAKAAAGEKVDVGYVTQAVARLPTPTTSQEQQSLSSSSSLLHLPTLDALHTVVERYLDLVDQIGPLFYAPNKAVKSHLFKLLHHGLMDHEDLRDKLFAAQDLVEMRKVARALAATGWEAKVHDLEGGWLKTSWYYRHRTASTTAPRMQPDATSSGNEDQTNDNREATTATEVDFGGGGVGEKANGDEEAHLPRQQNTTTVDSRNRKRDKRKVEQKLGLTEFPATPCTSEGTSSANNNGSSSASMPAALAAVKLYDLEGTWLAEGYERVVYGDHGPYVELGPQHMQMAALEFYATGEYYDLYQTIEGHAKLYWQKKTVADKPNPAPGKDSICQNRAEGYADYRVGFWYVSPRVLCVNGRTWTRRPGNEHANEAERSAAGFGGASGSTVALLSDEPASSSSSNERGNSGSGNGGYGSSGVVARNVGKAIGDFAGDYGICLHLTVSTGLERDAVQQLKALVAASPELSALVKKVSAPRAGLVMLLAIPVVSDATDAVGDASASNDVTDLNGIDRGAFAASNHASTTPSTAVAHMCRLLANLLCCTNMVEKAYAVVAQQLHQVCVLEDAVNTVHAQASAHRCGIAVALSTALQSALRQHETGNKATVDKGSFQRAANDAADTVKAETAAAAYGGFTFRVLGKRSGVGHKGFSSDDLKRACAAALLQTNQADWAGGAAACVDDKRVVSSAETTRKLVDGRGNISDSSRSNSSSSSGSSRREKSEASALACRLRRVNAQTATTTGNCATSAASTTATTAAEGAHSTSEAKRCAAPDPNHLTFLARVHDTSFSFLLLLHDGTLSRPQGKYSSSSVQ